MEGPRLSAAMYGLLPRQSTRRRRVVTCALTAPVSLSRRMAKPLSGARLLTRASIERADGKASDQGRLTRRLFSQAHCPFYPMIDPLSRRFVGVDGDHAVS